MCGINLIVDKTCQINDFPIKYMLAATHHRGPDFEHFITFRDQNYQIFLGNNRLKILDPQPRANQPFISPCGNYILIYNGEIYNFQTLKNQLIDTGVTFQSNSDTEVLLQLLIHKGEKALDQLNGMFAFVFYDRSNHQLLIARDRFGMKPVYYFEDSRYFILSSEIRGILASGLVNKSLNEHQIPFYLHFRYAKRPQTFFKNIYQLQPGCYINRDVLQTNEIQAIPSTTTNPETVSENDLLDHTEKLLSDSIINHLISDVPCGLFLSGGVDSTLILALLQHHFSKTIPSFSLVNSPKDGSYGTLDYRYAQVAAKKFGSDHVCIEVNREVLNDFENFIELFDQPIGDSGALMTYILSKEAQKSVKVVLSGAGADELFAGYNRHWAFYKYLNNYRWMTKFIKPLKGLAHVSPSGFSHPWRKKAQLVRTFLNNIDPDPKTTYLNFCSLGTTLGVDNSQFFNNGSLPIHTMDDALGFDRVHYLIDDVLAINDQMCMQNSVEMRMPFLDKLLVDYIYSFPSEVLLKKGRKWSLRKILERKGGSDFARRKKEGFGLPFGRWIKSNNLDHLWRFLESPKTPISNYIDPESFKKLLGEHKNGLKDNTIPLWSLLTLSHWLQHNFD
ncbi:MAG: asparagine synthase (glutamine-hydrolyzing) [Bacteroidetes bacterium]|nr:asparagine synthase (glutamine-hydrolyzing) [Bacteroidota bacterium]